MGVTVGGSGEGEVWEPGMEGGGVEEEQEEKKKKKEEEEEGRYRERMVMIIRRTLPALPGTRGHHVLRRFSSRGCCAGRRWRPPLADDLCSTLSRLSVKDDAPSCPSHASACDVTRSVGRAIRRLFAHLRFASVVWVSAVSICSKQRSCKARAR